MKQLILSLSFFLLASYMQAQCVMSTSVLGTTPSSCFNCDGTITLQSSGGTGAYTYTIAPNTGSLVIGNMIQNMCPGITYTITSTDASLCTATTFISINSIPPPTTFLTNIVPDTCGQCVGSAMVNVVAGTPPFTYNISGSPSTTVNLSGHIMGICASVVYTLTVTDALGCMDISTFVSSPSVGNLTGVTASALNYDASCNLVADGALDLTTSPSTGLSYSWSNGATTQDLTNVTNGIYTVTITDPNGQCMYLTDTIGVAGVNCGAITGKVYRDSVNNCILDAGDYSLINVPISLSTGDLTYTDASGNYQFNNVPYGTHTIIQLPNNYYFNNGCTQTSSVTLSAAANNSFNNDFKDSVATNLDMSLWCYSSRYVPGTPPTQGGWFSLAPFNPTSLYIQAKITLLLSDSLSYNSANITPANITTTPNGDSLTWFVTVPPFSSLSYSGIHLSVDVPTNLTIGSMLSSCASITPIGHTDINPANNVYCLSHIVASSFDPNDKQVQPEGRGPQGYITLADQWLDYRIRFQNTGTAPAQNVYIMDTLSNKLDINQFQVMEYSHPYQLEVLDGHILKFKFNNIMLPDSGTNMQASNGHIGYRIKQKSTNQIGDVIKNTAAIYFDFNAPVITNTTVNTIGYPTQVEDVINLESLVYPNPSQGVFNLKEDKWKTFEKQVYNQLGQLILSTTNQQIDLSKHAKGFYTLKLKADDKIYIEKIILR